MASVHARSNRHYLGSIDPSAEAVGASLSKTGRDLEQKRLKEAALCAVTPQDTSTLLAKA